MKRELGYSLKVIMPCGTRFGPGKAELMTLIKETGSISSAAKAMKMSYPRASRLVGEINKMFGGPIIETFQGGAQKGGAKLTERGHEILGAYINWTNSITARSEDLKQSFLTSDN